MSNEEEDLWDPLPDPSSVEIPEDVLTRQADLLSRKTQGTLVGEVRRMDTDYRRSRFRGDAGIDVELSLEIRVPRMDNYTYQLIVVGYNMARLYPVLVVPTHDEWEPQSCVDTEAFKDCLRRILRHADTQGVIAALRAHAEDPRARLHASRKQAEARDQAAPAPAGPDDDLPF